MSQLGKLIVFCAPSGSGKTTIVRHLIQNMSEELSFSVSATTRKPRAGEKNKIHYYFLDQQSFLNEIEKNGFAEYEEVYPGMFYGTLKSEIQRIRETGKSVILDIDVKGGINIKDFYKDDCLAVFVKVPNLDILEQRLRSRNTEGEEALKTRLGKAAEEMLLENSFDCSLINDELSKTLIEAEDLVKNFIQVPV